MATKTDFCGILSKNERKEKPTHADLKGDAMIEGRLYWVSGWRKETERGPFISLSFQLKQPKLTEEEVTKIEEDPTAVF